MQYLHPTQNVFAMRRYRELGELAYVAERKQQAMAFIRADYGRFARLSGKRFIYYWGGLPRLAENPDLAPFKNSLFLASSVLCFWGLGRALRKRKPGSLAVPSGSSSPIPPCTISFSRIRATDIPSSPSSAS
jgi:hypothetical protein